VEVEDPEQSVRRAICEPELSYFDLQAYIGTTKHMGGLEATKELVDLCQIGKDSYVLDVGCGVGATACYLAKTYGCRVLGVDLREPMVALSNERAQRLGVTDLVGFGVADAQALPFDDAMFDVVIAESVATFIEDKRKVVGEYARVVKPGGYVGMNEEIWLEPPPAQIIEHVKRTWEVGSDIQTVEVWEWLLRQVGLRDIVVRPHKLDPRREASQVKRYSPGDMFRMFWRTFLLFAKRPDFRAYMRRRRRLPKSTFEYLGYAVLVGRK